MSDVDPPNARDHSVARVVRTLKDGYWDRTEVVELEDGSRRVRKSCKGNAPPGPWGAAALRREIAYLSTLPDRARSAFPPLLATWDDGAALSPRLGYEMPFYPDHLDAGALARTSALEQREIDALQDALAALVLDRLHGPATPTGETLSGHIVSVVGQALATLATDPSLARLIEAPSVRLNGTIQAGTRAAFAAAVSDAALVATLDARPLVRLHGDLFLENILVRRTFDPGDDGGSSLLLIDPVSVAGVAEGPPLFDLVKYESYATGELPALRAEWIEVGGFEAGDEYRYRVRWESPELAPFRSLDWHRRFRRAFEAKYGPVDPRAYRLLDGYFSVAMAVNTGGVQRRARLLKATGDFAAAASGGR